MTTAARKIVVALSLGVAAAGCDRWPDESEFEVRPLLLPPVALDSAVAFVERNQSRVVLLDPADPALRARSVPVRKGPVLATRRLGSDQLLVLSRGERGSAGVAPEPAELTVLPAAAAQPAVRVPLGSRFTALAQSPDGRFLIAHFDRTTVMGEVLFNPNEVAIVDLKAPMPVAVARNIRSFSTVPAGVVFSPPIALPDGPRILAVVLADNYVTILDLDNPRRTEISVPLTLPDDRRTVKPAQVLFDAEDPTIYVRAQGSDDIYAMRLLPVPAAERTEGGNDFTVGLGQLAAGSQPADMALIASGTERRLLVVSPGSRDASVIDARTSRTTRIPLDHAANRIQLFDAARPGDVQSRPRALLLGTGLDARAVTFLDLEQLEVERTRNSDSRAMGAPAEDALFFPALSLAVVTHRAQTGAPGVSVIDLARRTIAPIFAEAPLGSVAVGPAGSDKIWIAPRTGVRLGFISLSTLAPDEVRLDENIAAILPMPRAADGKMRVVVVHPAAAGRVTVIDGEKPARDGARARYGFLLEDLLERGDR